MRFSIHAGSFPDQDPVFPGAGQAGRYLCSGKCLRPWIRFRARHASTAFQWVDRGCRSIFAPAKEKGPEESFSRAFFPAPNRALKIFQLL